MATEEKKNITTTLRLTSSLYNHIVEQAKKKHHTVSQEMYIRLLESMEKDLKNDQVSKES